MSIGLCGERDKSTDKLWQIHYLSLICPLTIIAVYLLLKKQRPKNRKKIIDSIFEKVACI